MHHLGIAFMCFQVANIIYFSGIQSHDINLSIIVSVEIMLYEAHIITADVLLCRNYEIFVSKQAQVRKKSIESVKFSNI